MDIIIQILLFPLVLPIYLYIIYLENKYEKEKKERAKNLRVERQTKNYLNLNELRKRNKK